jgi:hypothetical protein
MSSNYMLFVPVNFIAKRSHQLRRVSMFARLFLSFDDITRFPLEGFSWNLIFERLHKNLSKKFMFNYNLKRITGTVQENLPTFMTPRWVSYKSCRANQNTSFLFNNLSLQKSYLFRNNVVESCRSEQTADYYILLGIKDAIFMPENLGKIQTNTHDI